LDQHVCHHSKDFWWKIWDTRSGDKALVLHDLATEEGSQDDHAEIEVIRALGDEASSNLLLENLYPNSP
jgi:hypothetical protein